MIAEQQNVPWSREHDMPGIPLVLSAPRVVYPTTLEDLIHLARTRTPSERLRAGGSHWSLSRAAVSDNVFVETHDPHEGFPAMGRTLFDVVPRCLSSRFVRRLARQRPEPYDQEHFGENTGFYPIHVETGKRIYQAYAELDFGHDTSPESLAVLLRDEYGNPTYLGPWAFRTLGGAGGQTVFGALTTGTHGGDFTQPPIADSVLAMHLVADGGRHYWIEPSTGPFGHPMTDDDMLHSLYGDDRYGGPDNFEICRDDDLFNAVLVSAGRFGLVYSTVLAAVRQYSLHEERRLGTWQQVKALIADPHSDLHSLPPAAAGTPQFNQRFLQIAVCLTTHENFTRNLAGVTRRWNVPMVLDPRTGDAAGRAERRGDLVDPANPVDPLIGAPRFTRAGTSFDYTPDTAVPGTTSDPSFLQRACANADFMQGVMATVIEEIREFIDNNTVTIGGVLAAVAVVAGVGTLLALLAALAIILAALIALAAAMSASGDRLGQTLNDVKDTLLNRADPAERAAGLLAWQCIAFQLFSTQQANQDYGAISYAVMDLHNYRDKSCNVNVESVEVFFDASDPMLIAFVDALIAFEKAQNFNGKAFVGYASLRFTGATSALIGPEQSPRTCVVEVAGLADVTGSPELVAFAETLALNPNFHATLHWGQRNNATAVHTERRFGDSPSTPGGNLGRWRAALSSVTDHGRLEGFSNEFSRRTGLEVVQPVLGTVAATAVTDAGPVAVRVSWDCTANPAATDLWVSVTAPGGAVASHGPLPLVGTLDVPAASAGVHQVTATARLIAGGSTRSAEQLLTVTVP